MTFFSSKLTHIDELCSPPTGAAGESRRLIETALAETASHVGAKPRVQWCDVFYQLANRLAHLHFLRKHGVKAWLVLVNFVGDTDMNGPSSRQEWEAAYKVVWHVLGLKDRNVLSEYLIHIYPAVVDLGE